MQVVVHGNGQDGSVAVEPTKVGTMLSFAVVDDPAGATFALLQPYGPA